MADTYEMSEPLVIPRFRFDDKGDKKKLDDFKTSVEEMAKSVGDLFKKVSDGAKQAGNELVALTAKVEKLNDAAGRKGTGTKRQKVLDIAAGGVEQISEGAKKAGEGLVSVAEKYETLYFASRRAGASAANLKAFEYAARDVGVTTEEAEEAVGNLSDALSRTPSNEGLLKKMGIQTRDAKGQLRDSAELLAEMAARMDKLPAGEARKLGETFEIDDKTLSALRDGDFAKSFARNREVMRKTGLNQTADDAHRAAAELRELGVTYDNLVLQAQGALLHGAGPLIKQFRQWTDEHREVIEKRGGEVAGVVGKGTEAVGGGVLFVADQFAALDTATGGWSTRLMLLIGAFKVLGGSKLIGGIKELVEALGSVGEAIEATEGGAAKAGLAKRIGGGVKRMAGWVAEKAGTLLERGRGAAGRMWTGAGKLMERAGPVARGAMERTGLFVRGAAGRAGPLVRGALGEIGGFAGRAWPWVGGPLAAGLELMLYSGGMKKDEFEDVREWQAKAKKIWDAKQASPSGDPGAGRGLAHSMFAQLIARGEGDYGSVNRGKAHGYKSGAEDLENMTVAEVMAAQRSHRFNAAGRYQIIGDTLSDAAASLGLSGSEKFDRGMQDRIFEDYLVKTKRRGIMDFVTGKSGQVRDAVYATAKEWASVAVPAGMRTESGRISDGRMTFYDRQGKNRASITEAQMTQAIENTRAMYQMPGLDGAAGFGDAAGPRPVEIRQNVTIEINGVQDAGATGREVARHQARVANDLARQVGGVLQ